MSSCTEHNQRSSQNNEWPGGIQPGMQKTESVHYAILKYLKYIPMEENLEAKHWCNGKKFLLHVRVLYS